MLIVLILVGLYVLISLFIAIARIIRYKAFESVTWDVPYGDLEYYREPVVFDKLTDIFFPATLFILLWKKIVRQINKLL